MEKIILALAVSMYGIVWLIALIVTLILTPLEWIVRAAKFIGRKLRHFIHRWESENET